jgi:hypothetical protein
MPSATTVSVSASEVQAASPGTRQFSRMLDLRLAPGADQLPVTPNLRGQGRAQVSKSRFSRVNRCMSCRFASRLRGDTWLSAKPHHRPHGFNDLDRSGQRVHARAHLAVREVPKFASASSSPAG